MTTAESSADRRRHLYEHATQQAILEFFVDPVRAQRPTRKALDWRGDRLRGFDLSNGHLVAALLSDSDLSGTNLDGADLTDADLTRANLTGTSLRNAKLVRANLTDADLTDADLEGADLASAILDGARLPEGIAAS